MEEELEGHTGYDRDTESIYNPWNELEYITSCCELLVECSLYSLSELEFQTSLPSQVKIKQVLYQAHKTTTTEAPSI